MVEYIRKQLMNMCDKGDYQKFTSSLIPGCNNIIGIRQPVLKKYAKQLVKDNEDFRKLLDEPDIYHEETLLRGYIIGMGTAKEKDFKKALCDFKNYIPLVNNWAVNDSFCAEFRVMDIFREEFMPYIKECVESGDEYKARAGLIMLLDHYLKVDKNGNKKTRMKKVSLNDIECVGAYRESEKESDIVYRDKNDNQKKDKQNNNESDGLYLDDIFNLVNRDFSSNGYYTQMAAGWLLAECFVTFPEKTWGFLTDESNMNLDKVSYKKAIQKICESLTPDKEVKLKVREASVNMYK